MIESGTIFTPDKKSLLISEVQQEINNLNGAFRRNYKTSVLQKLKELHAKLHGMLRDLQDMKGVVTPQKTDEILDTISLAKKTRLESDYIFGIRRATAYLIVFAAVSVGLYVYVKKIAK